jgi:hypothetical protein
MGSAAVAVTLLVWRRGGWSRWAFLFVSLIFGYTTAVNVIEQPEGIKIAGFFIGAIILSSLVSRVYRTTELRVERVDVDATARELIGEVSGGEIHIIANRPDAGDVLEYEQKDKEQREDHRIPADAPVLFLEVKVCDASEFADVLEVKGVRVGGHRVLRAESSTVPNAIAAFLLHLRDTTGKVPHAYFEWTEGNPIKYLLWYLLFGYGDIAPVAREVLRQAEPDLERRPVIHVTG